METIKKDIRDFVMENYWLNRQGVLQDTDSFMQLGIIDSTGILELVSFVEEKFSILIEAEELVPEHLDSIQQLAEFVSRKVSIHDLNAA